MNLKNSSVDAQGAGNAVSSQTNLAITIFENDTFGKIRTSGTADEPLFCLADIGRVLEMTNVNACKSKLKQDGIKEIYTIDSLGRPQPLAYISEQNLYKLIMRSNKPQAEPFQDWVCGEVLPQIRKTGGYIPVNEQDDEMTIMAKALRIMQRTLEEKDKLIESQSRTIGKFDDVTRKALDSSLHYNVTEVAREFGFKTAGELYKLMEEKGYVVRVGVRKWMPTDKFPKKYWCWHPYSVLTKNGKIEGETLHLTEAAVIAMRAKRMNGNNNNNN